VIAKIPRYADLSAHVRGLVGYLTTVEQWRMLLEVPDLESYVEVLRNLPYGRDLTFPEPVKLSTLELRFSQTITEEYEKFIMLTHGTVRVLLHELWRRFELGNLKAILRHLAEERMVPIEDVIIPLRKSELPLVELSRATDLKTAVDLLSGTVYGPPLADALPRYESEGTLFPIEVALDLAYWRRVWRAVTALRGVDLNWAQRLIGNRLDALNITWAFRYRIYYDLSEEEIINYTLPYGYKSSDNVLRAIASGVGIEEVIGMVWGRGYLDFAGPSGEGIRADLRAFEVALGRLECRLARGPLTGLPFHVGLLLGYLLLKECEAHDLIIIAESKRQGMPSTEVEPYLVSYSG
jgi:vacuolar-type H+-ATPase subunit C/Vma6